MSHSPNEESAVGDFVVALFRACGGHVRRGRIVQTRKGIPAVKINTPRLVLVSVVL